MKHRRTGVFIAYCDMLLVIVAILIVSVAPKKTSEGVHVEAQYLVSIQWPAMLDVDVDLWGSGPPDPAKPAFYGNIESGALSLDRDSRGYLDDRLSVEGHLVYLPHKETMSLRGIVPGRYNYAIFAFKVRPSDDHRECEPIRCEIVVHAEVIKINPRVTVVFRKDFTLSHEGDAVNIWSMDVLPDGGFVEVDPPVKPITDRFYLGKAP